jgi:hypothetical protein
MSTAERVVYTFDAKKPLKCKKTTGQPGNPARRFVIHLQPGFHPAC